MHLNDETFSTVLDSTPLVSLDLVVRRKNGDVLLGQRVNRPAKDYWFVPGGRIYKNESLGKAFERLTKVELGEAFAIKDATLLGPYDHFYEDSVFGNTPSTHYVAIAYVIDVALLSNLPLQQHSAYKWATLEQLKSDTSIHEHTRVYFEHEFFD